MTEKPRVISVGWWGSKTVRSRLFLTTSFILAILWAGAGFVAVCAWIEARHPSDDAQRALHPRLQRAVTGPVVKRLSAGVARHVQRRAAESLVLGGLSLDETIARFLNPNIDLAERRIYAQRLAWVGTPECVAALLQVLNSAPAEHKAFMAQLVGSTGKPEAKAWLWPLLRDADERVRLAALHGLSLIGGDDVAALLASCLSDSAGPERIRIEAARGLGTLGTAKARDTLVSALELSLPDELAVQVWTSLGRFEFPPVAHVFSDHLADAEQPLSRRVAAVEALSDSSAEAVPFLVQVAGYDAHPEVRAAAAWAVSAHADVGDVGPALLDLAVAEPAVDVRRRLYEALLPQSVVPAEVLAGLVQQETDLAARVAGLNALGHAVRLEPDSAAAMLFDREYIPELVRIATQPNSLNIQLRSVFALRRAHTPAAQSALALIAQSARAQVATAASNGLIAHNR